MTQTFSPTVFVVDDDPAALEIIRQRFYEHTSLGVLGCRSLLEAREIIEDGSIQVNAILSDLSFTPDTQDDENHLYDGIDFLQRAKEIVPEIPQYVCSVWGRKKSYIQRSQNQNLEVREWFPKLAMDVATNQVAPWVRIERDLYRDALIQNREFIERACSNDISLITPDSPGGEIVEWVRKSIQPIRQTYLQHLGEDRFKLTKPIRVICEEAEGRYIAEASQLGLIIPGEGESLQEALDDLSEIIIDQYEDFLQTEPHLIVGYAEKVFSRLNDLIRRNIQ